YTREEGRMLRAVAADGWLAGSGSGEIQMSEFHIGAQQLDTDAVAHVERVRSLRDATLDRWMQQPHECPRLLDAGDDGIEPLACPSCHQGGGGNLAELSLHPTGM